MSRTQRRALIAFLLTPLLGAVPTSAEDLHDYGSQCLHCKLLRSMQSSRGELRFNPGTGQDLRNYPPDRIVDFEHMLLELDVPDMNVPHLTAKQTLTFTPIGKDLTVLELDAMQMQIDHAVFIGPARIQRNTTISYDGERLALRFDPPIRRGERADVLIEYSLDNPADGLFWLTETTDWPGRPPQIHSQGQPETNRFWFPCHDFPNERLTTEIITTIPEGFVVSANGRMVSAPQTESGRTTFHWLQDKPHPNYLVSLVVGKFDVADIAPSDMEFPMPVYVPPGLGDRIDRTYGRTAEMIRVFEDRTSEPYPWDQYAQVVVWNFGAGGMENTSATTLYDTAAFDAKSMLDDDMDALIAHELGHQWFGDLMTCKSWAHIWLNEGWAVYMEALWFEQRDGYQRGYQWDMYKNMRGVADRDQLAPGSDSFAPAMTSPVYEHPWEVFRRDSNPYPKGASVIHMLRMKLGDEAFFEAVAVYVDRHKFGVVETDDFRKAMEDVSGLSLEQYFHQWCERPGSPNVHVKAVWDETDSELDITVEQRQRIDADHPAFVFRLPITIEPDPQSKAWAGREAEALVLEIDTNSRRQSVPLPAKPGAVVIDPRMTVLMKLDAELDTKWLVAQLGYEGSITARLDAARLLASHQDAQSTGALVAKLQDKREHYSVRARAAESLGLLRAEDELASAAASGIVEARVRVALINALGEIGGDKAIELLKGFADDDDESYACRTAALEALGKNADKDDDEAFGILVRALGAESQHDTVLTGALRGLTSFDSAASLEHVIGYTKPGTLSRVRPVAIEAAAELADHDIDLAFKEISPLVHDHEARASRAAGMALVAMEDERAVEVFDSLIASAKNPEIKSMAKHWRDDLLATVNSEENRDPSHELERLKRELERLKSRIEK
jgi:aminopeptidase N